MIGQSRRDPGHDPHPLTATGLLRLVVAASTVVAVQVSAIDPIAAPVLRHIDLPLVVAASLVLIRPAQSTVIGLIFGLVVDASGQRLFGLHCVAYAVLGPIAHSLPVPAWHRPGALTVWRVGTQALGVSAIVAVGGAIAAGHPAPGIVSQVLQTAVLAGLVAVPVTRCLGPEAGRSGNRSHGGVLAGRSRRRPRSGALGPLGP